ncbi:hypothetical protein ACHWQZ_G002836 [Mnemiopsis leidyi]
MATNIRLSEALELYDKARPAPKCKPCREAVQTALQNFFGLKADSENPIDQEETNTLIRVIERHQAKMRSKKRVTEEELNRVLISRDTEDSAEPKKKKKRSLPLDCVGPRQMWRRQEELLAAVREAATEENTSVAFLLGSLINRHYYHSNRKLANVGKHLMEFEDEADKEKVSVAAASNLKNYNNLGREGYQRVVRTVKTSGQQVADILEKLESGQLKKKAGDQESRQGVTQCPIMDLEVLQSISPLHAGLRFFDFLLKIIYRLECSVFVWSEEQGVLGRCYQFLQAAKKKVRAAVKEGTGVAMDIPDSTGKGGTSTSGNVVHTLLSKQSNIDVLVSLVDEKYHSNLKECISRCYTITKLYNSDMLIDVEAYRQFCKDTKRKLLTDFNGNKTEWIYLTPTVHSILEHGADLIEANDGRGLLSYSESGLECNNKILRLIRISLSRKTSQADNLSDCLTRLAIRSDPEVRAAVPEGRVQTK